MMNNHDTDESSEAADQPFDINDEHDASDDGEPGRGDTSGSPFDINDSSKGQDE